MCVARALPRLAGLSFIWACALVGCRRAPASLAPTPPPSVTICQPVERSINNYGEYTGWTQAKEAVDVRARVNGYLDEVCFKDGDVVKKDQLLFKIDQRPYVADLHKAEAELARSKANFERATADFKRAEKLIKPKTITQEEYDRFKAALGDAEATTGANEAAVEQAQLNVDFTTVEAPIDGRIGRPIVTQGNLVNGTAGSATLLTTIVSIDPMYAYFDVDERTMLRYQEMVREGKVKSAREHDDVPVELKLASESDFLHKGVINFIENKLDPATGTINVRGTFENKGDLPPLVPGLFVRVRIMLDLPRPAMLVTERAITSEQGVKYVWVVDEKKAAQRKRVTLGPLIDGMRVIEAGVEADDWVVVNGLQRLRPGIEVKAEREEKGSRQNAEGNGQ
jgi:RND family efflux transporter MFP subunit